MAGAGGAAAAVQPAAAAGSRSGSSSAGRGAGGGVADPRAEALRCPRCDSANTKFCYYNNYSLSQPRHFCKACKRYWTRGGTLRNVPVGGGCRKNKRSRSSAGSAGGNRNSSAAAGAGAASSAAGGITSASSPLSLSLPPPGSLPSLTSALGLPGGTSLASLLLGSGSGGDHLGLFQAMQSVVSDATAYEMQQQQHTQVDQLLGLGYGAGAPAQIQVKPWQQHLQDGAGGILDGFYAPLLSGSLVPGLEELQVKTEAAAREHQHQHQHQHKASAAGEQSWDLPTSSSNVDANIIASDALMAAAASMNPAVSNASTAPAASSLMYWGNGGIGGAPTAWPDIANCGSSIATFF